MLHHTTGRHFVALSLGLGSAWLDARLRLLKALSLRLGLSQLRDRLSVAQLNSLFGPRLISAFGSGSAWDSGISSMGSAQLVAWVRLSLGLSSGLTWGLARDSGFDLACLMAHLASLGSAWCLGSGRDPGSVRLGSPARLETQGSAQDSALDLDRSLARLISVQRNKT